MESNYNKHRPLYRPIPTKSEVISYGLQPKWKQRESAYAWRNVSSKRSLIPPEKKLG